MDNFADLLAQDLLGGMIVLAILIPLLIWAVRGGAKRWIKNDTMED